MRARENFAVHALRPGWDSVRADDNGARLDLATP